MVKKIKWIVHPFEISLLESFNHFLRREIHLRISQESWKTNIV